MDVIGFAFRPTEEELVDHYLRHRLLGDDPQVHVIPDIDLCEVEPWHVPTLFGESDEQVDFREWFFFSPVGFKYSNSKRINRTTKCGFWKPIGKDREIRSSHSNTLIATKKTLVYYKGRVSRGEKSNWVIHEYHAVTFHESQRTFVLCRLMKKPGETTEGGGDEGESSGIMVPGYENQSIAGGIPSFQRSTLTGMETTLQQDETSFPNYSYHDAYFRNESNIEHISYETTQEEEFLNSIFCHDGYVNNEQNIKTFYNNFTQSESLRKVYRESSDTDAEAVSEQGDNITNIPTVFSRYLNVDEYHSSKGFDSELSDVDVEDGVGYGFRPTDEELVHSHLKHKLLDDDPHVHVLTDIDLSDVEPSEIPEMLAKSVIPFKNSEWFFFSPVKLKYSNSERFKRTTKSGFWKPTGEPRDVRTEDTNTVIGTKKTLVFYIGRASKAVKSNWVIHEYHALNSIQSQNAFVLCRLKKKPGKTTEGGTTALICDEEESSRSVVSDNEHQAIAEGVPSGDTSSRMETICQLTYQAEKNISPAEQSLIDIEKDEASFPNPSNDAYFRKEINNRHIPYAQTPFEPMHTSLGSTQNPFEAGSMLTLFEPTQPSFETTKTPFETMETPFDTRETLLGTMQSPLGAMQTPLGAMYTSFETTQTSLGYMLTPLETTQPSFETIKTPLKTMETPFDTMETLSGTLQSPLGAMYTSLETTQTSLGSMLTPLETTQPSFETIKTPFETMETPFDTMETLSGTMQSPLGAMQTPLGAMYTSFETMQTSLGSMLTPFEATQPSFETTNTPFETMETPLEAMVTPLGAMYTSFETTQTSLGSMLTPFETTQTSFETSKSLETPFETIETPLGAMYTPPEMMHPPSETTQIPLGSMQTPFGVTSPLASRKIPFESRKIPFQNTHTPSQTPFEFPKSLKRAYCESTCINPEVVLKLKGLHSIEFGDGFGHFNGGVEVAVLRLVLEEGDGGVVWVRKRKV
ncbi:hypothetical protein V8G54_009304 [Vigna mungo]|uniref:NAC domain-containing protein n=1 Tax=Vigna mungo TaxID=3915 RepID=A0AAQ3S3P9_VIGMU